ncbi:hypothetical protein OJF2_00930 [Aquisphaera giovannonii]|uniref:Uncharacterized protein n=1 Tax=Aquisphaera giovannonii TaxID=406548 RepID=A0A5B9VTL9_9BACT|nr:hypothetical protein [Aquisphaera giovannonii]QEH31628.1 hypothetical protein OJF2_00930 [Aquisphaera giovannonii]
MKQAQYAPPKAARFAKRPPAGFPEALSYPAYAPAARVRAGRGPGRLAWGLVAGLFRLAWFVVTLPIRLVLLVINLVGRLTGIAVGFGMMVVGMALCISPFFIVGVPVFVIGLLLTMRCLG